MGLVVRNSAYDKPAAINDRQPQQICVRGHVEAVLEKHDKQTMPHINEESFVFPAVWDFAGNASGGSRILVIWLATCRGGRLGIPTGMCCVFERYKLRSTDLWPASGEDYCRRLDRPATLPAQPLMLMTHGGQPLPSEKLPQRGLCRQDSIDETRKSFFRGRNSAIENNSSKILVHERSLNWSYSIPSELSEVHARSLSVQQPPLSGMPGQ
ncbi:unnamed protein product [Rangifer tarandus platyrhynchus]|uniref:Uncharacterized protein n=1 Tax=Rangifer tarandus platyrhynchus TaxID=3082113 RepID=A0ABN8XII5_RANTA|nr:unnamed protein product [Rangifer tarandus platyrhynchus]